VVSDLDWQRIDSWRNRLAWRLCNLVLRRVATSDYRTAIGGAVRLGLEAAAKLDCPGSWICGPPHNGHCHQIADYV
jgi:hypothetical protein